MNKRQYILIFMVILVGCIDDAPRDNPLDPLSPAYITAGSVKGVVHFAHQLAGVAGVTVTNLNENIFVLTDSLGNFSFNRLTAGVHRFVCSKQNFTNDTFQVEVNDRTTTYVVRGLNAAPMVLSQSILTRKIDQYFPSPQYFVEVAAEVTDPNNLNELESVWFVVDTLQFPMEYSLQSKKFITTVYKYNIPTNTIQWLVGKPLYIVARDTVGATGTSAPFFVTRVIEQTATPIPSNPDSLPTFELKWLPPEVTFNFSYTVTLSRIDGGVPTLLKAYTGINSFYEKLTYPYDSNDTPLSPGNYLWSVTVVDDFGNYARSKESSFTVK